MKLFNPAIRRVLTLSRADQERILRNEEKIKQSGQVLRIADLPNFPFKSMQEIWAAKECHKIEIFSPVFSGEVLWSLGARSEVLTSILIMALPYIGMLSFLVSAIVTSKLGFLFGVAACWIGFFLYHPSILLGILMLPLFYVLRGNPTWLIVLGGFYISLAFSFAVRIYTSMVIERIALSSEVFFCYLYYQGIISVKNTETGLIHHLRI